MDYKVNFENLEIDPIVESKIEESFDELKDLSIEYSEIRFDLSRDGEVFSVYLSLNKDNDSLKSKKHVSTSLENAIESAKSEIQDILIQNFVLQSS